MLAYLDRVPKAENHNTESGSDPSFSTPDMDAGEADALRGMELEGWMDFTTEGCAGQASRDFGGIQNRRPALVVHPFTTEDVRRVIEAVGESRNLTVAARGNGHSISGQAQTEGGVVVEMQDLRRHCMQIGKGVVEVGGGELWCSVLRRCVDEAGVAPRSWTDYLGLTIGGTLSVGGVSGQSFKYGPQICNVTELEVVTGTAEVRICSPEWDEELFFGVLGGLGQFGVITKAKIIVQRAPETVRWVRLVYADFDEFSCDQESLITPPLCESVDYVEGFVITNNDDPLSGRPTVALHEDVPGLDPSALLEGAGPMLYCIELIFHFREDDDKSTMDKRVRETVGALRRKGDVVRFERDVRYVEFLERVHRSETAARADGSWYGPHPWLNIFISSRNIKDFDQQVFRKILREGIAGPLLVYPMLRSKWDARMSIALPNAEIFYLVALLRGRGGRRGAEEPSPDAMLAQNEEILRCCMSRNYDFKIYIPHYTKEKQWMEHFGKNWDTLMARKTVFDPKAILAPGQTIFPRVTC